MKPITQAESRKRLMMIERKTRHVKPDKFWFGSWVGYGWGGKPDLSCGTTACAVGWATTIPYLRKRGLHLIKLPTTKSGWPTILPNVDTFTSGMQHLEGVAKFLGLTIEEYKYLFTNSMHGSLSVDATNIQVANHLREFINDHFPEFRKLRPLTKRA